jgi:hypothetical protein
MMIAESRAASIAASSSSPSASPVAAPSRKATWAGRIIGGLPIAFLLMDAGMKVANARVSVEGTVKIGYPAGLVPVLGWLELAFVALYLWPRTAILGAVLWTGYLGGAVATHVRLGDPLFSHTLFPIYFAALLWGGLWLRSPRLRAALRG